MTTMTTDMPTCSLLGRALDVSVLSGGLQPQACGHATAHAPMPAADAYATATTRTDATAVVTNPWLGGFGFADGKGICPTTVVEDSTKRIHPGRLEGMT